MQFDFQEIDRVDNIDEQTFINKYYKPQLPVVIKNASKEWPAFSKWNLDYIKEIAGNKIVPLYDNEPVKAEDGFNEPKAKMSFAEYVDLLKSEPTDLRIFLFNILKEVPQLQNDFNYPSYGLKIMKTLPMLFFGGAGSNVFMHYDLDLANIFHYHFDGNKECILVSPVYTPFMYKIPYSIICREDIDFDKPNFDKFPALQKIKPYKTHLQHGDMLYMPEGYWHYMKYITPGFSMSLRSMAKKPNHFLEALYNVFIMRHYDAAMRKIKGNAWIDYKNTEAIRRTHKAIK